MTIPDWQPPDADQVWLLMGSVAAVIHGHTSDGNPSTGVAVGLRGRLNLDPRVVEDERTYILDGPELVVLIAGLMGCGNLAFGKDAMQAAFADALGVTPSRRDETIAAVERALDDLDQ